MKPLLEIRKLSNYYTKKLKLQDKFTLKRKETLKVLDNVSIDIYPNETLGLVGESGCGKTTLAKCILRLIDNVEGTILFENQNLMDLSGSSLRKIRKDMQMIFQNPYSSFNQNMKIYDILAESVKLSKSFYKNTNNYSLNEEILKLCKSVNFREDKLDLYPFKLSGGERRRISVARILTLKPKFLIADEPVAALDVSIKSQIINLLLGLQKKYKMTYLIISHDIGLIKCMSDRIAVMFMGRIVEVGNNRQFRIGRCLHPYTEELLEASDYISSIMNIRDVQKEKFIERNYESIDYIKIKGCKYRRRCYFYNKYLKNQVNGRVCREKEPELKVFNDDKYYKDHLYACHFATEFLRTKR